MDGWMEKTVSSTKNADFKTKEYWNSRFREEVGYEWLMTYSDVKESLIDWIVPSDRILIIGCGNSNFSEDLYNDGFKNIVNIDFSEVCIRKMSKRCKHLSGMTWKIMDMRSLDFPTGSFDVVIEKAAIDALMTSERSMWTISKECKNDVDQVLSEVSRVLRPDGRFLSLTFVSPILRKPMYVEKKYDWSIQTATIESTRLFPCYLYMMRRGEPLSVSDLELHQKYFNVQQNGHTLESNEQDNESFLFNINSDVTS